MKDETLCSNNCQLTKQNQGTSEDTNYIFKESIELDSCSEREPIKTFVFFDIEATGLKSTTTKPRITELSFVAIDQKDFKLLGPLLRNSLENQSCSTTNFSNRIEFILPRVVNKLTICVNPMKMIPPNVSDITGLDNYNLECMKPFSRKLVQMKKKPNATNP